mgnify:CR=1 FL=1
MPSVAVQRQVAVRSVPAATEVAVKVVVAELGELQDIAPPLTFSQEYDTAAPEPPEGVTVQLSVVTGPDVGFAPLLPNTLLGFAESARGVEVGHTVTQAPPWRRRTAEGVTQLPPLRYFTVVGSAHEPDFLIFSVMRHQTQRSPSAAPAPGSPAWTKMRGFVTQPFAAALMTLGRSPR